MSRLDHLLHFLRQLQRAQFGRRSEKPDPKQLALAFEGIEQAIAANLMRGRLLYGRCTAQLCSAPIGSPPTLATYWNIQRKKIGAGEGNRTLVISLEGCCSTIELHPHSQS